MAHPELPSEQAHVDLAYERLAAMRASAESMLQDAFGERGGTYQSVTERDIRVRNSLGRLEQLQLGRESLVFGRIYRAPAGSSTAPAGSSTAPAGSSTAPAGGEARREESFHIGRLAISDVDQEPLVVDWRAPVAEPFYRATGAHPMGLSRRRHLLTEGPNVLDLEDELFDADGDLSGRGLGLSGPQVLMATLDRSRTGRMRDIVATVQREQDEVIRAALPGILVVQGGPGTGKTAVALHRAAYLLYTHRFPLETQGVLVVGPNPTFLRYIEHVLPSLDETGAELSTVGGLYHRHIAVLPDESDEVAALKGDARMASLIMRALSDRERPLRHNLRIPYGRRVLQLTSSMTTQAVAAVKRRPGTHNARRRTLEAILWRQLFAQLGTEVDGSTPAGGARDDLTADELGRSLRRMPEMVEALDRMWPLLTPENLLHDLFGAPPLVELAGRDLLSAPERRLLLRARVGPGEAVPWSESDVPLLDEAYALLGPRRRSGPGAEGIRTFGHVVVDEAQDLSPMQLRMIARRSLSGSMTVVGDIAQATGTWVPSSWAQVVEHLPARRGWRLVELTINYRTPVEIMEMAARVLEKVAPGMRPPDSVRSTGRAPRVVAVARPDLSWGEAPGVDPLRIDLPRADKPRIETAGPLEGLVNLTAESVGEEVRAVFSDSGGTVGVIVPPSLLDGVGRALEASGTEFGYAGRGALGDPVTLLTVEDAKGLEFDSVTVVEPTRIVEEAAQGLRALYVAFTRATQRLLILHADSLPAPLASPAQHSA
jgi:DNA helicase IV